MMCLPEIAAETGVLVRSCKGTFVSRISAKAYLAYHD